MDNLQPQPQSPPPSLPVQTIESVVTDTVEKSGKNPEEKLEAIKKVVVQNKLDLELKTHGDLSLIREATEKALAKDENEGMPYLGDVIDNLAHRKQAEQEMSNLPGLKDVLNGVEKVEDLRSLDAETLIKLEDHYEGILLYAFTDIAGDKEKLDFKSWSVMYKEPKPGTKLQVDFRGNSAGEGRIGAADLLSPSVRGITVYENADPNNARKSLRRIGLKGRNQPGNGFFDANGYMAVHSGDTMEISGVDASLQGPLNEESYKRYSESPEAQNDKKFLDELYIKNPNAQRRKQMSTEEIDALMGDIEARGTAKKVLEAVQTEAKEKLENPKDESRNCGQIAGGIYRRAGVSQRQIFRDTNYDGLDCGDHHATPEQMDRIESGDWLWYNNKNPGWKGLHSAIFLRWINKETGEAEMASGYVGRGIRIHTANLKEKPVTRIVKPV